MSISSHGNQITLRDGRRLAYDTYGDPNGRPVFFFHGAPGSRLLRHPDQSLTQRLNLRVIAVDRPGYGLSDPKPQRTLLDWPDDVAELADALSLERFAVMGVSGGGPHAAACAFRLPERVTRAVLISSPAPFEVPGMKESLKLGQRLQFALAVKAPWLVRMMMRSYARAAQKMTAAQVLQKLKHDLPPAEFALFRQPGMIEMVIADTLEAFRQGGDACAHEWGLAGAPWGFSTSQIAVPVHVWQGDLDANVSLAMGRYLGSTIPECRVTVCPGGGHYIGLTHWAEILGALFAE